MREKRRIRARRTEDFSDCGLEDQLLGDVERSDDGTSGEDDLSLVGVQVLKREKSGGLVSFEARTTRSEEARERERTLTEIDSAGEGERENLLNLNPLRSIAGMEREEPWAIRETGGPQACFEGSETVTMYEAGTLDRS